MKTKLRNLASAAVLAVLVSGGAGAADFVLPTPENNTNATYGTYLDASGVPRDAILMDGIPIAFKYDDFWSYSAKILDSIQTVNPTLIPESDFGTFDFSTGTGTIIANLSSVAGGATNDGGLQDPVDLAGSGDNVTGWTCEWGGDPQWCNFWDPDLSGKSYSDPAADQGTTTTVGELLALLQSMDPDWTIPVLYADYNQTGVGDSLFMSAQVQIIDTKGTADPSDDTVEGFWQLDSLTNDTWDQNAPTYNYGGITFTDATNCAAIGAWDPLTGVGCAGVTTSGLTYTGDHNTGSGKPDFMAFAPDMDLSGYDSNFLWVATVNLGCNPVGVPDGLMDTNQGCNTNGFEEFGIAGGVGPSRQVPEPSSLALLGLGLAAAGFGMRRRSRK